jgi:hypothetical protein
VTSVHPFRSILNYVPDDILGRLKTSLEPLGTSIQYNPLPTHTKPSPENESADRPLIIPPPEVKVDFSNPDIVYIGEESLGLTNILVTHGASEVHLPFCFTPFLKDSERRYLGLLLRPKSTCDSS